MKRITLFAKLCIILITFSSMSCSIISRGANREERRFIKLMNLFAPENKELLQEEFSTQYNRDAFLTELDTLYRQLIDKDDFYTFRQVADVDSYVAGSIGVFGVMEIANKNYMINPESKRTREQCLEMLERYTSHLSPHVRSAAFYSLGVMRQYEYKDIVIKHLRDTVQSRLFFPPFIEFSYSMDTSVDTQASQALIQMLGKEQASPIIQSEVKKLYPGSTADSD